jgi:pimeloyl-ACP methyl ester carboxylesterase
MDYKLIETNFPISVTIEYYSGFGPLGSFYEGFFNKNNSSSLIVLPGDGFGSWAYRKFAELLLHHGVNVFLLNYPSHFKSHVVSPGKINNHLYFEDIKANIDFLTEKYKLQQNGHSIHFLGHSRGAYLLQAYCSEKSICGRVIFEAPLIYHKKLREHISFFQALHIVRQSLLGNHIRLPYQWFKERFLSPNLDSVDAMKYYQCSHPFFRGVLFSRLPITFSQLVNKKVYFILYRQDKAVNMDLTLTKLDMLKASYNLNPSVFTLNGRHCDLITHPENNIDLYVAILKEEI